jgi:hypothetical protein
MLILKKDKGKKGNTTTRAKFCEGKRKTLISVSGFGTHHDNIHFTMDTAKRRIRKLWTE